jgi:hypothetical protein
MGHLWHKDCTILCHKFDFLILSLVSHRTRNIQAIKVDVETWKTASLSHRIWYRDTIKTVVSNHEKNLDDCFRSFTVSRVSCCNPSSNEYSLTELHPDKVSALLQLESHTNNLIADINMGKDRISMDGIYPGVRNCIPCYQSTYHAITSLGFHGIMCSGRCTQPWRD